ncbi:hypothetical protein ACIGO9_31715 [Nocardia asteroides]|uniref:hypothetical protein n=1 Tax=Nocardia asteroides TaxID=1824 RepID=UPI0037C57BD8
MNQHICSTIDIIGSDDHRPTRALWTALGEVATWPVVSSRTHADLTIYPVHDLDATDDCWYELWWTHPGVVVRAGISPEDGDDTAYLELEPVRIEKVCVFPAPLVIPVEQRLAALEPLGEVTVTAADRSFWGPEDAEAEKREWLEPSAAPQCATTAPPRPSIGPPTPAWSRKPLPRSRCAR